MIISRDVMGIFPHKYSRESSHENIATLHRTLIRSSSYSNKWRNNSHWSILFDQNTSLRSRIWLVNIIFINGRQIYTFRTNPFTLTKRHYCDACHTWMLTTSTIAKQAILTCILIWIHVQIERFSGAFLSRTKLFLILIVILINLRIWINMYLLRSWSKPTK